MSWTVLKKTSELVSGGYFNVEVVMPDGAAYHSGEFDELRERVGIAIAGCSDANCVELRESSLSA